MDAWRDCVEDARSSSGVAIHVPDLSGIGLLAPRALNQDTNAAVGHPAASARVASGLSIAQAKGGTQHG
jgi:hypothetical protein